MAGDTHATRVLAMAGERGQVRSRDLTEAGIPRAELMRLVRSGRLKQVARGLYALPAQPFSALHPLAEVAARSSRGVFCLLTALHFHQLLRHSPAEIWLAIPNKARAPVSGATPLRVVRFSGPALTEGVQHYVVDGVPIRVYSAAKTIADCFKFRRLVGTQAAEHALHEAVRRGLARPDELRHCAEVCRVVEIMRPLLERAAHHH